MKRPPRERINLSLSPDESAAVRHLAEKGGFKNSCQFAKALLLGVVVYAARQELAAEQRAREPTPMPEEIAQMFAELESIDNPDRNAGYTIVELKGRRKQ